LAEPVATPYIGERGSWVGVPREILQVDDVGTAFAAGGECGDAKRMDGDVGIEFEKTDITLDQLLHGPPRDGLGGEAGAAAAAGGVDGPEERARQIVADAGGVEPGFETFLGFVRQGYYGLLFQAASETLRQIAAQPKHLGAKIGFLAVLHTWGQNLMHHPHLHCVVPAGGLSPDGKCWIASSDRFFLPVHVLSRVFRGKFVRLLKRARKRDQLAFHGSLQPLADRTTFEQLIDRAVRSDWVVYAKPPFG